MRKRFLLPLLVLLMTTLSTHAYDFQSGDLYYNITSENTVKVTYQYNGWTGNNYRGLTTATIPETVTYGGTTYSVTSIGDQAFYGCSSLTSITIPNSVTSIGDLAFEYCKALTSITIPNSVTSIGDGAFYGCSSLTSITIPESVTSIGDQAFYGCSSLTSITIPNSVTSIGSSAFSGCSSITSITIPNSVTSIEWFAFCKCSSLTSITIPNSVTSIGVQAFNGCSSLTSITIPNSVTSIGNSAFSNCSSLSSVTIPNSVTSIGDEAFRSCSSLTSIVWNAKNCGGWSSYDYAPFYDIRSNITSFTFGDEVETIPSYLCYGMSSLTSITIPNSVTSIGGHVFEYCKALTSITIPNSVTSIGDYAFDSCKSLTSITIPNSVTSIGGAAFQYCSSLTSITIPNSVTSIELGVLAGCNSLTSIVVESGNTIYDSRDNCNAIIETASNTLIAGCQSTIIPNSVTSIGSSAFSSCSSLTSITIPESVTSIGDYAFEGCSSLTSITIPNSVTSIGDYAFQYCRSLTQITCLAPTPPTCSSSSFSSVPRNIPLYVPAESVEAYKAAETWKEFDVQALSTDATLSSLTYDGMMVPFFDADTLHYTVELPSETVAIPVVDAVANDLNAQVVITQAVALPGEATVEVIATDGTTRQTYTIYFSKKSTPTAISDRPDTTETVSDKSAEKLLRDGQVVIIRNGETYDMMGQRL